jgi:probable HAF family extracellular repeat protein
VSSGEPASAVSIYTFQTLDAPDAVLTDAIGINGAGQIVGYYFDVSNNIHSFLFSDGIYTPIEVPGASFTQASGINDAGRIVGFYGDTNQRGHGFLRSDNDIDRL